MVSRSKLYFSHWCNDRFTGDELAFRCSSLYVALKLEIFNCNITDDWLRIYLGTKSAKNVVINEKADFRKYDITFNIPKIRTMSIVSPRAIGVFKVGFGWVMSGSLESLHIDKFRIENFEFEPFRLPSLTAFCLTNGNLKELKADWFKILPSLRTLDLTGNNIREVPKAVFLNLVSLEHLLLGKNKLKSLAVNVFQLVSRLKTLELDGNIELDRIPSDYFTNAGKLEVVTIAKCSLKFVGSDWFPEGRYSVKLLNLSHNKLITIQRDSFSNLYNLETIDISHKPIGALHLTNHFDLNPNLRVIVVNNCNLTKLPVVYMKKYFLTKLDLSHNRISYATLPSHSKDEMEVLLNDNNIAVIGITLNYGKISRYLLANNPVRCNCQTVSFIEYLSSLKDINYYFPDILSIYCSGTDDIKLVDVKKSDFQCPAYCPLDCYCVRNSVYCESMELLSVPFPLPKGTNILHLENNRIRTLTAPDPYYWDDIVGLYISNSEIESLDDWDIPSGLIKIAVDGNKLKDLPPALMARVEETEGFEILLASNQWKCDCEFISMKR